MSRFQLISNVPGTTVHVGWDNPLQTFFAHVQKAGRKATDEPQTVLWIGTEPSECLDVQDLQEHILPWAKLPPGTAAELERQRDKARGPTQLQAQMLNVVRLSQYRR
ncbi:hypothetical protein ABMY26_07395 (plasmid) [Azospirillum sp. HJ39]|uniref:hypothetical protein n=1 Tax=Azospirillum sp. HJ39 TaxID=3159496 RepID=UPI0035565BA3